MVSSIKNSKTLPVIADYTLTEPWQNTNSGNARWSFAKKDGKQYFIKEFLSPTCPSTKALSPEVIAVKKAICYDFYRKKRELYDKIALSANGNIVTIDDFFLFGTKYYITTEKIDITKVEIETIAKAPIEKKLLLLKIIADSLARLHEHGVVHADLKPNNILIKESGTGSFVAKIIDFDSSYLVGNQPDSEEVQGDMPYLAPETCRYLFGEDINLTPKADIFAAGLLFHQYFTGKLPLYPATYDAAYEALLDGETLFLSESLPPSLSDLIGSMLEKDPDNRPDMKSVLNRLTLMGDKREEPQQIQQRNIDTEPLWSRPTGF